MAGQGSVCLSHGLSCYYIIKSMIPLSFGLLTLAALARLLKQILVITGKKVPHDA